MSTPKENIPPPAAKPRIYDLVREAGVDVSDWANSKRGKKGAAANPKYCYEWSFFDIGKNVLVLCVWFDQISRDVSGYIIELNLRRFADEQREMAKRGTVVRRALRMDEMILNAFRSSATVRIVINDGTRRYEREMQGAAKVEKRGLDTEVWHVASYSQTSGDITLRRGSGLSDYVDQFDYSLIHNKRIKSVELLETREVHSTTYVRSAAVRAHVMTRAKGRCEYCGGLGFRTPSGIYLETHHIIPLADRGPDTEHNVIALCPNDHRRAHYSLEAEQMRDMMIRVVGDAESRNA